jgi:hypothetical protein
LLSLGAYTLTLAPTFYNLDSAEFAIGVHTLGIVHATGYPLYLLLGRALTTILPFADLGYELNLLSALYAGLTLLGVTWGVAQLTAREQPGARWGAYGGAVAALCLGFSYYFWAVAVIAEVYTLQTFLLSMALGCLLRWESTSQLRWLVAFALFYSLCFANHISIGLTLPALLWYVARRRSKFKEVGRRLLHALPAVLVGPLFYLYFPLRYRVTEYNLAGTYDALGRFVPVDLGSWQGMWWLLSGQMFRTMVFGYTWSEAVRELGAFLHQFWGNFLGLGIVIGVIGIASLWRRHKSWTGTLLIMFGAHALFFVNYRAVDKALMFLPCYLLWAYFMGAGFTWLLEWVESTGGFKPIFNLSWSLLLVLALYLVNYAYVDLSDDYRARSRAEAFLDKADPDALVVGWWTEVTPIQYLQYVEGERADLDIINRLMISDEALWQLVAAERESRTVYLLQHDYIRSLRARDPNPGRP